MNLLCAGKIFSFSCKSFSFPRIQVMGLDFYAFGVVILFDISIKTKAGT